MKFKNHLLISTLMGAFISGCGGGGGGSADNSPPPEPKDPLTAYKNQTIEYKPFKMQPADTEVLVRTQVNQPGGKPVQIDYNLEKLDEGWKVFDVVVAGVSLVTNYRDTFTQEVRAGGVDGLIKSLQTKNKASEAKAAERK